MLNFTFPNLALSLIALSQEPIALKNQVTFEMPAEGNNTTQQLVMFGDIFVKALVRAIENERNKLLYFLCLKLGNGGFKAQ